MPAPYQQERWPFSSIPNDTHLKLKLQSPPSAQMTINKNSYKPFVYEYVFESSNKQRKTKHEQRPRVLHLAFQRWILSQSRCCVCGSRNNVNQDTMYLKRRNQNIWESQATYTRDKIVCCIRKNHNRNSWRKFLKMKEWKTSSTQDLAGSFANSSEFRMSALRPFSGDKR